MLEDPWSASCLVWPLCTLHSCVPDGAFRAIHVYWKRSICTNPRFSPQMALYACFFSCLRVFTSRTYRASGDFLLGMIDDVGSDSFCGWTALVQVFRRVWLRVSRKIFLQESSNMESKQWEVLKLFLLGQVRLQVLMWESSQETGEFGGMSLVQKREIQRNVAWSGKGSEQLRILLSFTISLDHADISKFERFSPKNLRFRKRKPH